MSEFYNRSASVIDLGRTGVDAIQELHRLQVEEDDFSTQEHRGEEPGWSFDKNGEKSHLC